MHGLGLHPIEITSTDNGDERAQKVQMFNDPNHASRVLVTSMKLASVGLNLQRCASAVFVLEFGSSINLLIQAISRVTRIGQRRPQHIHLVLQDNTYDDVGMAKAADKFIDALQAYNASSMLFHKEESSRSVLSRIFAHDMVRRKLGSPTSFFDLTTHEPAVRRVKLQFAARLTGEICSRLLDDLGMRKAFYDSVTLARNRRRTARVDAEMIIAAHRNGSQDWYCWLPRDFKALPWDGAWPSADQTTSRLPRDAVYSIPLHPFEVACLIPPGEQVAPDYDSRSFVRLADMERELVRACLSFRFREGLAVPLEYRRDALSPNDFVTMGARELELYKQKRRLPRTAEGDSSEAEREWYEEARGVILNRPAETAAEYFFGDGQGEGGPGGGNPWHEDGIENGGRRSLSIRPSQPPPAVDGRDDQPKNTESEPMEQDNDDKSGEQMLDDILMQDFISEAGQAPPKEAQTGTRLEAQRQHEVHGVSTKEAQTTARPEAQEQQQAERPFTIGAQTAASPDAQEQQDKADAEEEFRDPEDVEFYDQDGNIRTNFDDSKCFPTHSERRLVLAYLRSLDLEGGERPTMAAYCDFVEPSSDQEEDESSDSDDELSNSDDMEFYDQDGNIVTNFDDSEWFTTHKDRRHALAYLNSLDVKAGERPRMAECHNFMEDLSNKEADQLEPAESHSQPDEEEQLAFDHGGWLRHPDHLTRARKYQRSVRNQGEEPSAKGYLSWQGPAHTMSRGAGLSEYQRQQKGLTAWVNSAGPAAPGYKSNGTMENAESDEDLDDNAPLVFEHGGWLKHPANLAMARMYQRRVLRRGEVPNAEGFLEFHGRVPKSAAARTGADLAQFAEERKGLDSWVEKRKLAARELDSDGSSQKGKVPPKPRSGLKRLHEDGDDANTTVEKKQKLDAALAHSEEVYAQREAGVTKRKAETEAKNQQREEAISRKKAMSAAEGNMAKGTKKARRGRSRK
jgi:hypothetical protein